MREVRLSGYLKCKDGAEAALVLEYLPEHLALTRAEPGCISFEVAPSGSPLVWTVEEHFASSAAFRAHQARVAASVWGRTTSAIERDYTVVGLTD
ncbi:putative quinol monooxygenase [Leucobacter luti]|uniref:putative quinol monooxygenase n=1 Tax=Leucobacter luti TaxID=340320 RepID=UPI003CFD0E30